MPELTRLKDIFAKLQAISIALDSRLAASEASLTTLSEELKALSFELSGLKAKLNESLAKSETLEAMLKKSESSLGRALDSLTAYRKWAEVEIARLKREAGFWRVVGISALAIGGVATGIAILK